MAEEGHGRESVTVTISVDLQRFREKGAKKQPNFDQKGAKKQPNFDQIWANLTKFGQIWPFLANLGVLGGFGHGWPGPPKTPFFCLFSLCHKKILSENKKI